MSLLFTCPQLTVEESSLLAAAAARMWLLSTAHVMQYFYQIESYHTSLSCGLFSMHLDGTLILLYFIEMLPCMVSGEEICSMRSETYKHVFIKTVINLVDERMALFNSCLIKEKQ